MKSLRFSIAARNEHFSNLDALQVIMHGRMTAAFEHWEKWLTETGEAAQYSFHLDLLCLDVVGKVRIVDFHYFVRRFQIARILDDILIEFQFVPAFLVLSIWFELENEFEIVHLRRVLEWCCFCGILKGKAFAYGVYESGHDIEFMCEIVWFKWYYSHFVGISNVDMLQVAVNEGKCQDVIGY